jgi:hypothetical protein
VHKHSFDGVADAGTLRLCVNDYPHRHIEIGLPVHICDAQPDIVLDHRHPRITNHCFDQGAAAARNDQIYVLVHFGHVPHRIVTSFWNEQDTVFGQPGADCPCTERFGNRGVRVNRFRAATQDDCVSRLCAKHRRIARHVRARLVDDSDNADGDTNF